MSTFPLIATLQIIKIKVDTGDLMGFNFKYGQLRYMPV